jgi:hypothetical protein
MPLIQESESFLFDHIYTKGEGFPKLVLIFFYDASKIKIQLRVQPIFQLDFFSSLLFSNLLFDLQY